VEVLTGAGAGGADRPTSWVEHLRVDDLSCGTYVVSVGATDAQQPHTEDEIYLCTGGRATLWTPSGSAAVVPGTVAFVPAGEEHRFVDVEEDLTVVVVFAPAEHSREAGSST
jgi:quercetin dioxygenase-like cupin family protein